MTKEIERVDLQKIEREKNSIIRIVNFVGFAGGCLLALLFVTGHITVNPYRVFIFVPLFTFGHIPVHEWGHYIVARLQGIPAKFGFIGKNLGVIIDREGYNFLFLFSGFLVSLPIFLVAFLILINNIYLAVIFGVCFGVLSSGGDFYEIKKLPYRQ